MQIDTLVRDIEGLFGGKILNEIDQFSGKVGELLQKRFTDQVKEEKPELYMSNIGKPLRQLWYTMKGYKGEVWLTPQTKMKFLFGDVLELLLIFLAEEAGHDVKLLQERVELDGVRGKIDCTIDGVLVDVKSASDRSFFKFKSGKLKDDDPFGYIAQLAGYSEALGNIDGAFLVINKEKGTICLDRYSGAELKKYHVRGRIGRVKKALESSSPPERCYEPVPLSKKDKSGNLVLGTVCKYCEHKQECWKDSNGGKGLQLRFYAGKRPVWFVNLLKEPRLKKQEQEEEEASIDADFPTKELDIE